MTRILLSGLLLVAMVVFFQNCGSFAPETVASSSNGGNGEPYGGKPEAYYAFTAGFTCDNETGTPAPHPSMVIEKSGDLYVLKESACVPKNEILLPGSFVLNAGFVDFDFRRFQPAVPTSAFLQPTYEFTETHCLETLASRLMRKYGVPVLPPDQLSQATADEVESVIFSTYYGVRRALITIRKDVPLQGVPSSPINKTSYMIPEILINQSPASVEYLRNAGGFAMTASRPSTAPVGLAVNYDASLNMDWGGTVLTNISLSCNIYPH